MAEATNTFMDGMTRDVPSMQMPATAYTAALNATLTTTDGNEGIMQNDMGNGKIYFLDSSNNKQEVSLSPGFVPVGVKESGGIIYIASVKKQLVGNTIQYIGELGTFPSPDYTIDKNTGDYLHKTDKLQYKYAPLHNMYQNLLTGDDDIKDKDLSDFSTKYLNFDLEHTVNIEIQPSYDGSVNLLLTDNFNKPRLINSAFSVQEGGMYTITKHIGNNNTNIYSAINDIQFQLGVSLQKQSYQIPKLKFLGLNSGGQLKTGGYVIYIKASDEDGNTTDVIAESGIIPVFFGSDGNIQSVNGGYADMRTDKQIRLHISNVDSVYSHVKVYYSRSTSAIEESANTLCYEIQHLYPLVNGEASINITGFEATLDINSTELNTQYFVIDKNRAAAFHQNYTFVGNVKGSYLDYETLRDLSLHIYPTLVENDFEKLTDPITNDTLQKINLDDFSGSGYASSKAVYYFTGYHNEEIYRFGVVYTFSDGSHSQVYNVLGINNLQTENTLTQNELQFLKNPNKTYKLLPTDSNYIRDIETNSGTMSFTVDEASNITQWNRRGACRIFGNWDPWKVRGIRFNLSNEVIEALKNKGIIGVLFVRQKRIPLRLMQAFTTPIFENTFTPAIKYGSSIYGKAVFPMEASGNIRGNSGNINAWDYFPNYLAETFYKNVYDKTNRNYDVGSMTEAGEKKRQKDKELRVYFPKIGEFQNTRQTACRNMWWNLTQDYNQRLLPLTNYGLVYSNKTYKDTDDSDANSSSVNGPYSTYDGKYPKNTGAQPLTQLLQQGAYACFSPEFELNQAYYNAFFTGQDFNIKVIKYEDPESALSSNTTPLKPVLKRSSISERIYFDQTNNYKVKTAVNETGKESEYFKVKLISVADGVSLLGIQRNFNKDNESKDAVTTGTPERPYWKYRDTVYFSSKVGDLTDKLRFKEVGGERVQTFAPLWKYCDGSSDRPKFFGSNGEVLNTSKLYYYDNNSDGGQSLDEKDSSSDDASEKGKKIFENDFTDSNQQDEWFTYPYNLEGAPTNLIRGLFSPYIGLYISNSELERFHAYTKSKHYTNTLRNQVLENAIINIYIPGFKESNIHEYFKVVMQDKLEYYSISDPISLEDIKTGNTSIFNIKAANIVECYRGDCYASSCSHRLNRNFQDSTAPSNDTIVASGNFNHYADGTDIKAMGYYGERNDNGDNRTTLPVNPSVLNTETQPQTDANKKNKLEVNLTNLGDLNAIQLGSWFNFNLSTTMNIALRSDDRSYPSEKLQMGQYRSFYPLYSVNIGGSGKIPDSTVYNKGFSISGGVRQYMLNDTESYDNTYYKNRIYYSNVSVDNGLVNGARTILSTNFQDYDAKYGSIVKLIGMSSYLLCIMEHACALITVQPRAALSAGSTDNVYINTSNILDDRLSLLLTDTYGTTWEDAVVETPQGVYGIDTFAKKIWFISNQSFNIISDNVIASFLNDNLNITNEKFRLGELRIKAHYNLGKQDVIFTCYQYKEEDNENVLWSICYNEQLHKWTTFYSWIPEVSANIGNTFISIDHRKVKDVINGIDNKVGLWKHGPSNFIINSEKILPTTWYGETQPFEVEFVVAQSQDTHKLFTNLELISNKAAPESFHYQIVGQCYENAIDKPTQYYRQEKTKELWHRSGSDIIFDPNYKDFHIKQRPLWHYENNQLKVSNDKIYVKSLVPWNYYVKYHNPNKIEDYYKLATANNKDYSYLVGTELVKDKRLQELCIETHTFGNDVNGPAGVLRGNMKYMEDKWYVQINPLQYKEKNEAQWEFPPIVFNNSQIPNDIDEARLNKAAQEMGLTNKDFDFSDWGERKSFKLKDKYIKIRIRYSGKDKVILQAIKTLYQISFS